MRPMHRCESDTRWGGASIPELSEVIKQSSRNSTRKNNRTIPNDRNEQKENGASDGGWSRSVAKGGEPQAGRVEAAAAAAAALKP